MKIRHPLAIRATSLLLSWVLRGWLGTLGYRVLYDDPHLRLEDTSEHRIYLFWHEMMLFPACTPARRMVSTLISRHADGELIAQTIEMMGGRAIRGSTNRQGLSALREMMRRGNTTHLAITPDGPRGPRRVIQPGAIYLASRTGMPIVPTGLAFGDCWRSNSWDRMALPWPNTHGQAVVGRAIRVPPEADRPTLDHHCRLVQWAMDDVQNRAEKLVERGLFKRASRRIPTNQPAINSAPAVINQG